MNLTDNEGNILCEIQKVTLKPDDIVVLKFDEETPLYEKEHIKTELEMWFPNNLIIHLNKNVQLLTGKEN